MPILYASAQLFKFTSHSCKNIPYNRYRMYSFLCLPFPTILEYQIRKKERCLNTTCSGFHKLNYTMEVPDGLFRGVVDRFNGVTIDSSKECEDKVEFTSKLQKSLHFWIENGYRCIWFKVHKHHSNFIPELTKTGFDFHHAKDGFVMLYRWLTVAETANIPDYAHTVVGVGGLVVNNKNEILVVTERHALIPNSWKLPGGYVEPKEDLVDAAIREVQEETGIETEFVTVIAFRHSHGGGFGCSDLYFVIGLKPITEHIKTCPREISNAQWMPIAEYLEHPNVHETNRTFLKTFLHYKEKGITFNYLSATHKILNRKYFLYTVDKR